MPPTSAAWRWCSAACAISGIDGTVHQALGLLAGHALGGRIGPTTGHPIRPPDTDQ